VHHFPDIREKYREIRRIGTFKRKGHGNLMRKFSGLEPNSLVDVTGNLEAVSGKQKIGIREYCAAKTQAFDWASEILRRVPYGAPRGCHEFL
jgi:hypothetical protein